MAIIHTLLWHTQGQLGHHCNNMCDAWTFNLHRLLHDFDQRRYSAEPPVLLRDCNRRIWKAKTAEKTTSGTATAAMSAILRRRAMRAVAGCSSDMTHSPAVRIMLSGSTPSACRYYRQHHTAMRHCSTAPEVLSIWVCCPGMQQNLIIRAR